MIYTSYFAKLKSLPDNIIPISICARAPDWYKGILDRDLNIDEKQWMVFTENRCVESWCEDDFSKTGEFVDVYGALIK